MPTPAEKHDSAKFSRFGAMHKGEIQILTLKMKVTNAEDDAASHGHFGATQKQWNFENLSLKFEVKDIDDLVKVWRSDVGNYVDM